ncbi:MAG TPA: PDZ domain-containing protein [Acidimicrobiales bacterium]
MESGGQTNWWRRRRTNAKPPPRDEREWVHPSELPSFEKLRTHPNWPIKSPAARVVVGVMAIALVVGSVGLYLTRATNPAPTPHLAVTLSQLPTESRTAADHTIDLSIATPGHVEVVAAMALPHDLAVTTTQIPANAIITGSTPGHVNFHVTWVGRDKVMGFSIVRLGVHVPALTFAPLPSSKWVVAVSPILKSSTDAPQYAWANTILGDPEIDATGVISYLSTKSDANLDNFIDAIAVNQSGQVVAVLSINHFWYSAQFVARIAYIVATGRGCHASLGVVGTTAQGGGVTVSRVIPKSPSQYRLKQGDVITALNGKDTETFNALDTALYLTPAYTKALVTFVRASKVHHAVMTLACAL